MESFNYSDYFDLTSFAYPSLFEADQPVWAAIGRIKNFLLSQKLGNILGDVREGSYLVKPELISIGKGTVIEPGAYIQGPCIIGENCQIRHGAYIRGNLITADRCVIGHATEVKNAIFLEGAQAGHFAYVGDSILGARVNLGAGTKCANLRFDKKNVTVCKIDTGLRKFGAIFGDDSQTGCNSVTNPGTLMGKGSQLGPCAIAKGVISKNHTLKAPENVIIP